MRKATVVLALLTALVITPSMAHAVAVDLELALLVDVSGSVDGSEYTTQMGGYSAAFRDATIQGEIAAGNGIAVSMVQWSSGNEQSQVVGWTLLTDAASSNAFADAIDAVVRAFDGLTAPGSAINFAVPTFDNNGFEGDRLVIDVSGDGRQNDGASTTAARDAADAADIVINGLAIQTDDSGLGAWYTANLKTPTGFVVIADDFADFEAAVDRKILTEVVGVIPEPMTMAAMFMGVAGIAGYIRKRRMA